MPYRKVRLQRERIIVEEVELDVHAPDDDRIESYDWDIITEGWEETDDPYKLYVDPHVISIEPNANPPAAPHINLSDLEDVEEEGDVEEAEQEQ